MDKLLNPHSFQSTTIKQELSQANKYIKKLQNEKKKLQNENTILKNENQRLKDTANKLQDTTSKLKDTTNKLQDEIKKLKESFNLNSNNSSKPPSTDNAFTNKEYNKKNINKKVKKRKRGNQKGNTSNNLLKVDNPDYIKVIENKTCTNCNCNLESISPKSISTKQVFDIPNIKMEVTEYRQHNKVCPKCNTINKPRIIPM